MYEEKNIGSEADPPPTIIPDNSETGLFSAFSSQKIIDRYL